MLTQDPVALAKLANRLRLTALETICKAGSGHPGGSLSALDLLTALYFSGELRVDPACPLSPTRDFFVLSKAHASPALYVVLAEMGFFPRAELAHFRQVDSLLQGHPNQHVPGVEVAGGSLGQGLSFSIGAALAFRAEGGARRAFCLLGDGELQEGQVWEAAMAAGHYRLANLVAMVDNNGLQIDGAVADVLNVAPIPEKFRAFGWEVVTIDGHDLPQILAAFAAARACTDRPFLIHAVTVKGKGAPAAEGNYAYHGVPLSADELAAARENLVPKC